MVNITPRYDFFWFREDQSVISGGISPNPSPVIVPVALTPLDKSKVTLR